MYVVTDSWLRLGFAGMALIQKVVSDRPGRAKHLASDDRSFPDISGVPLNILYIEIQTDFRSTGEHTSLPKAQNPVQWKTHLRLVEVGTTHFLLGQYTH